MLAGGCDHSMVVVETAEGCRDLYTWGRGSFGGLWHGSEGIKLVPTVVEGPLRGKRVASVAAGWYHSMAVVETAEGCRELYTWGDGASGRLGHGNDVRKLVPTVVEGPLRGKHVVSVAAGWGHSMAVVETAEGCRELYTWGNGRHGRLGHGSEDTKLIPTLVSPAY